MTVECYFRWCRWHHQDEPFCTMKQCEATHNEIELYRHWRDEELTHLQSKELPRSEDDNSSIISEKSK